MLDLSLLRSQNAMTLLASQEGFRLAMRRLGRYFFFLSHTLQMRMIQSKRLQNLGPCPHYREMKSRSTQFCVRSERGESYDS